MSLATTLRYRDCIGQCTKAAEEVEATERLVWVSSRANSFLLRGILEAANVLSIMNAPTHPLQTRQLPPKKAYLIMWARPLTTTYSASPLTETEEEARRNFKLSFTTDYSITSASELIILDLASYEYVKAQRLQLDELSNGSILGNLRFHPINELVRLLSLMDATRAAKLRSKQPVNDSETEMKTFLLTLSEGT